MLEFVLRFREVDFSKVNKTDASEFLMKEAEKCGLTFDEAIVSVNNILKQ